MSGDIIIPKFSYLLSYNYLDKKQPKKSNAEKCKEKRDKRKLNNPKWLEREKERVSECRKKKKKIEEDNKEIREANIAAHENTRRAL